MQSLLPVFIVLIALASGAIAPVHAQRDHMRHYQAYNEALERGDGEAAARFAEAAWRAAGECAAPAS